MVGKILGRSRLCRIIYHIGTTEKRSEALQILQKVYIEENMVVNNLKVKQNIQLKLITLLMLTNTKLAVDDVVACPAPIAPDITLPMPSRKTPLLTACGGGGGAWLKCAHA